MLKRHSRILSIIFFISDGMLIVILFVLSHILFPGLRLQGDYIWLLCVYILVWPIMAAKYSFYSSKRLVNLTSEVLDLFKICIIDAVLTIIVLYFLGFHTVEPSFILFFSSVNILGLSISRLLIRNILRFIRKKGFNYRNVLIVGMNERAREIIKKMVSNPEYGLHILGVVDTKDKKEQKASFEGNKVIGCIENFEEVLTTNVVDEVYITLPIKSFYTHIEKIVRLCEEQGATVNVSSYLFQLRSAYNTLTFLDDIPLIKIDSGPMEAWKLFIKRGVDILISSAAIMITLPIFIIVPILIKLDSEGPVFFKQERAGYNMRKFALLKFRTMFKDAEELRPTLQSVNEADGPVFKMKNDPRITHIGRLLRKYSIDELPQLINVLKGDMSLVGPRPPLPSEIKEYEWYQRRRLSMKPGITCLWQIYGRNKISFKEWMKLDLEYIDNWSLQLDIIILIRTIPVVLKGTGI